MSDSRVARALLQGVALARMRMAVLIALRETMDELRNGADPLAIAHGFPQRFEQQLAMRADPTDPTRAN